MANGERWLVLLCRARLEISVDQFAAVHVSHPEADIRQSPHYKVQRQGEELFDVRLQAEEARGEARLTLKHGGLWHVCHTVRLRTARRVRHAAARA